MRTIARYDWEDSDGTHKNDIKWDTFSGGLSMCEGIEAYAQTIEAVVKTVRGELITNREYGIPYFSTIFDGQAYAKGWAEAVQTAVSALDFVSSIDSFEYEYDENRKYMTYKMIVTTTTDDTVEVSDVG